MGKAIQTGSPGYSETYVEQAFLTWYANGQPPFSKLVLMLDTDHQGHRPGKESLGIWYSKHGWGERAAELDKRATDKYEAEYVNAKAAMMVRHAHIGRELAERGWEYIETHQMKSAFAALRAIELGIQMEKDASNLGALFETVAQMGDEKIRSKLDLLLAKARPNYKNDSDLEETEVED